MSNTPVPYFIEPFGLNSSIIDASIPVPAQSGNTVSYDQGWTSPYQGNYPTDPTALPVPMSTMNRLFLDITGALQQYQNTGIPQFITAANNGGSAFAYGLYAMCQYNDTSPGGNGIQNYISLVANNTTIPSVDGVVNSNWRVISGSQGFVPTGAIVDFATATAPLGYLACDGSAISRTIYANLFSIIGTTWGAGDGSTTFNLPNAQRSVRVGAGGTSGNGLNNTVGSTGGYESANISLNQIPNHTHNNPSSAPFLLDIAPGSIYQQGTEGGQPSSTTGTISGYGSQVAFPVIQPSFVVLTCIKY